MFALNKLNVGSHKALSGFMGNKAATFAAIGEELAFSLFQVIGHNNPTAYKNLLLVVNGTDKKSVTVSGLIVASLSELPKWDKRINAVQRAALYESVAIPAAQTFVDAMSAAFPAAVEKTDEEKAKAKTDKSDKKQTEAIKIAESMGMVSAEQIGKTPGQMTRGELLALIASAQFCLAEMDRADSEAAIELAKNENAAKARKNASTDAAKLSAKTAAKLSAKTAKENAANIAKPAIVESVTAIV